LSWIVSRDVMIASSIGTNSFSLIGPAVHVTVETKHYSLQITMERVYFN